MQKNDGNICAVANCNCMGMLEPKVRRVRQTIDQLGWLNGCLYLVDRCFTIIASGRMHLHKYYFVAQPVAEKRWLSPRRGATLEVRQIDETDPIIKMFPRPEWAIPYRFRQGAVCLAESKAGHLVGFLWFTIGPYQEDEVRCRYVPLPAGTAAWDFDVYVHPEHRNGIAFLKLWDEANSFLSAHDVRWSLSRISAFNSNSMLSHAKMGAKRIGTATFLSIGSCQLSVATVPPYLHFSMRPESFPVFALNPGHGREDASVR
jgi:hypothetical protein